MHQHNSSWHWKHEFSPAWESDPALHFVQLCRDSGVELWSQCLAMMGGRTRSSQKSHRFFSLWSMTTENTRTIFKLDKLSVWKSQQWYFLIWMLTCWSLVLEVQSESRLDQHFSWRLFIIIIIIINFISSTHTKIASRGPCKLLPYAQY